MELGRKLMNLKGFGILVCIENCVYNDLFSHIIYFQETLLIGLFEDDSFQKVDIMVRE